MIKQILLEKVRVLTPDGPTKATGVFKGESSGLLNWDDILYPKMYQTFKQLLANFWMPSDISMVNDVKDFGQISPKLQETFLTFSTMLSALDSIQTHALMDIKSFVVDTSVKHILMNVGQQETIHTQCYSYINSNLVSVEESRKRFNELLQDDRILKRNLPIAKAYEKFSLDPTPQNLFEVLVHSTNLEGIYFVSAFVFFYALARQNKMMGSATMISYINRDEMVHYDFVADLLRILLAEYPELNTPENVQFIYQTVDDAVELEKEWAYSTLGELEEELDLDMDDYEEYIEYVANKRLRLLGLDNYYKDRKNVMPWIKTFNEESLQNTKTDQFENKPRSYGKAGADNGFDEL